MTIAEWVYLALSLIVFCLVAGWVGAYLEHRRWEKEKKERERLPSELERREEEK